MNPIPNKNWVEFHLVPFFASSPEERSKTSMKGFLLSRDLLSSSQIAGSAQARGWPLDTVADLPQLLEISQEEQHYLILVDLSTPHLDIGDAVNQLKALTTPPVAILAFGPHVHQTRLDDAAAAGCDQVLTRGQMSRDMMGLLQEYFEE